MPALDRSREYLLWYEFHRDRWIALPVVRSGARLELTDYPSAVLVAFDETA